VRSTSSATRDQAAIVILPHTVPCRMY